jgi:biopolymer transport protein ExbD
MAFSLGNTDADDLPIAGEINVTPFIDVILVLLIIFMVAAPISTVDIPVDLPAAFAPPAQRPEKPIFVTIKADLSFAVGETSMDRAGVVDALRAATALKRNTRIFIRADKSVPYGEVMQLFNAMRADGFLKVAMVGLEQRGSTEAAPR